MRERLTTLLDDAHAALTAGRVDDGMNLVVDGLNDVRADADPAGWASACSELSLAHRARDVLHQCPFTSHSFSQPRGYPGDAGLLDLIYERQSRRATTDLGTAIFAYAIEGQAPRAVRHRRELLAERIDAAAARRPDARVLSIACGHLREAQLSRAVNEGRVGAFVAFDQDEDSLAEVRRCHGDRVTTVHGSVRSLLAGKTHFDGDGFDLVYAAGLYDYLAERTAARLTRALFDCVRPGGRLLVANFAPTLRDIGYMEAFMRWHLIYRTADEVAALARELPADAVADSRVYADPQGVVYYLEVERRDAR